MGYLSEAVPCVIHCLIASLEMSYLMHHVMCSLTFTHILGFMEELYLSRPFLACTFQTIVGMAFIVWCTYVSFNAVYGGVVWQRLYILSERRTRVLRENTGAAR